MKRDWITQFQREQLHRAAQDGDLARVEDLLRRKYPVNRFDDIGKTPLHYAARAGHMTIVDRLLEAGANVNAHDERCAGDTPLGDVARECSFEMARRLIEAGADPTIAGGYPLYHASRRKDADARKILRLLQEAAKGRQG